MKKNTTITSLILLLIFSYNTSKAESDKLDVQSLEKKYWATKDDDFTVIQNRTYTKNKRFYLNLSGGVPFNDVFSTGTISALELGYYFNERWGVQYQHVTANFSNNDVTTEFVNRHGTWPDHNKFKGNDIISGSFVPFYAKMSVMDKSIIYFDMGLSLGVGTLNYEIMKEEGNELKSTFVYQMGIFQQIFFTEHWALRVDLYNKWATEDKLKYKANATDRNQGSKVYNDTSVMFGATYWF